MIRIDNKLTKSEMNQWDCTIKIIEDELGNINVKGFWWSMKQFEFQSKIPETVFEALANELIHVYTKVK